MHYLPKDTAPTVGPCEPLLQLNPQTPHYTPVQSEFMHRVLHEAPVMKWGGSPPHPTGGRHAHLLSSGYTLSSVIHS